MIERDHNGSVPVRKRKEKKKAYNNKNGNEKRFSRAKRPQSVVVF